MSPDYDLRHASDCDCDCEADVESGRSGGRRLALLVVGALLVLLGGVLTFRPFTTVRVLVLMVAATVVISGVARLAQARTTAGRADDALAVVWIAAAAGLVFWPGVSTAGVAVVVGVVMLLGGIVDVWAAVRGVRDERTAGLLSGAASIILGVVALSWPSVTILVVAVVLGVRTVLLGLSLVLAAVLGRSRRGGSSTPPGRVRRLGHVLRAGAALVIALALGALSVTLNAGEPVVDDFYATPDEVPSDPGALLRTAAFTREIPEGATAQRILYTTTTRDGEAAVASGLVIVPDGVGDGPLPVIAWAHGTTGVDRTCAPSVLEEPLESGAFFALDRVMDAGWALVAADYVGLGAEGEHPYLVGEPTARSVLDAVRAARDISDLDLREDAVVWGHSQGGGVSLWTGQIAPDYAPDVGLLGVAALAPASDTANLVGNLSVIPGGSLFASYVVQGYADHYDDVAVDDYVAPGARASFDELNDRCLGEPAALVSILESISTGMDIFDADLASGPLGERVAENVPTGPFTMPVLIGQGETDPLVLPTVQADFAALLCDQGYAVDYRSYPDRDHVGVVAADSPLLDDLVSWTQDVLSGTAPATGCG